MPEDNSPDNERPKWGRIFIGTKDSELANIEHTQSRAWTEKDEEEYLERVRLKAVEKAREILNEAEAQAETIRKDAQQSGYADGMKQAEAELNELRDSMGDTVTAVLSAIEGQCGNIFSGWRDDLTELVYLSVEKALGITLGTEKSKVLEALYLEAVQMLESHKSIVVKVNPEDEAAVADIISMHKENTPEMLSWKVKGDPTITPGGLLVESESSLADNTIESRKAAIEQALVNLSLPAN